MNPFEELSEYYLDQPNEVSLETLSLCNARCTFCPYPTLDRRGNKMDDALIDRVIDEISGWEVPFYFSPFKVNEPLLDSRLIDICQRVNEKAPRAVLRIFTNGQPLTPKKVEEISQLKRVGHLWISLNSHKPDEYKELMGLDFDKTARRIDYLHEAGFPFPVVLSTVGYPNEPFRYYCFKRWPNFQSMAIEKSGWLGYVDPQRTEVPQTPCSRWFELSITSSGIVSLCCMDSEAQFPIGDIREQTLLEIYNAPAWKERREKLLSRTEVHPCSTCTY